MRTEKQLLAEAEATADGIASEHFFRTEIPGSAIPQLRKETAEHLVHFYREGRKAGLEEAAERLYDGREFEWADEIRALIGEKK